MSAVAAAGDDLGARVPAPPGRSCWIFSSWPGKQIGPHLGLRELGVAHHDAVGPLGDPLEDLVVDVVVDQRAGSGDAGLPGGGEDARRSARWRPPSRSASGKTMLADLPPSSSVTAARWPGGRPGDRGAGELRAGERHVVDARVGDQPLARPARDAPLTVLNTPGGKPACSNSSASSMIDTGACSDGLATMVQPAASAGASLKVSSSSGEFHGRIAATTPTGSRVTNPKKSARPVSTTRPSILSARPA